MVKRKKKMSAGKKSMSKKPKKKLLKKAKKTAKSVKRKNKISAIPKGYNSVTPCLTINNAAQAIDFYKTVFGAKEVMRMAKPNGKIGHAELKIGDTKIMLADEYPEMDIRGPEAFGGTPVGIHIYIKNVDQIVEKAVSAGANVKRPPENMFYGDRSATLVDPYGHVWHVSTHIEDVSKAQMRKRAAELFGENS